MPVYSKQSVDSSAESMSRVSMNIDSRKAGPTHIIKRRRKNDGRSFMLLGAD